jgi:hypothetical protein
MQALSIYITADGDYGDAHGMYDQVQWKTIVPTFFYTDEMWEEFDACVPSERIALHYEFTYRKAVNNQEETENDNA